MILAAYLAGVSVTGFGALGLLSPRQAMVAGLLWPALLAVIVLDILLGEALDP